MSRIPERRTLESFRKEAKRWLQELRDGNAAARARFERALDDAPQEPTLRDTQHAIAREHGVAGWNELRDALDARDAQRTSLLSHYDEAVAALLDAYNTGTPEAMERHYRLTWHRRAWSAMRSYVQLDLGKRPAHPGDDVAITIDDARWLVAREHGFDDWATLQEHTARVSAPMSTQRGISALPLAAKPVGVGLVDNDGPLQVLAQSHDWNEILDTLSAHPYATLHAQGQMTDAVLDRLSRIDGVTALSLGGSQAVTDAGVLHLQRMTQLRTLDLSSTAITDHALRVLATLHDLDDLSLAGTRITDDGARHLAHCRSLRKLNLSWTRTGDGAIRALAGLERLIRFSSGAAVGNDGLALLRHVPAFAAWNYGDPLQLSRDDAPTQLALRGVFTDDGMQHLQHLHGLAALDVDDRALQITARGMGPLGALAHLTWLSADAKDDWMPVIAAMPSVRFLGIQDTVAGDDGFVALSKSQSIERIWGRRCHNLRTRGFTALGNMPRLASLSVSCLNVEDSGIATLPQFPALRELMPMDVPDAGYRHIGRCTQLDSLVLMYCRDTTDAATEHITTLPRLRKYFNSYTTITDRTPELLSTMGSLEEITFDACHGLTNIGVAGLARLPRLRELRVAGRGVTDALRESFGAQTRVSVN